MAFSINQYLRQQSIRLQREDWKQNAQLLGDEMYAIMSNIQLLPEDQADTDDNGNPIPSITPINLPDLGTPTGGDTDYANNPENPQPPDPPVTDPVDPNNPGGDSTTSRQFYFRSSHPGKITGSSLGSGLFPCDLYVNGLLETPRPVTAQLTDASSEGDVEEDSWVTIFLIAKYEATSAQVNDQTLPETVTATRVEYLFNAPVVSGGKIGVVTTRITGGTAASPGEGKVLLKKLENNAWVTGEEETVYSTVSGTVETNKDVQMKRVSGRLFVDVEDCGGEDDA